ncbi:MAG: hypothetical protein ACPGLV_17170 [Bacteroidia bacterium]
MNKKFWIVKGLKFGFGALLMIILFTYVTMSLWNWLMPMIFGLMVLNFWQTLGLLLLSKILFGGFPGRRGGGHKKHHWKHRMKAKWENMSSEEKAAFKSNMKNRFGDKKCNPIDEMDDISGVKEEELDQ